MYMNTLELPRHGLRALSTYCHGQVGALDLRHRCRQHLILVRGLCRSTIQHMGVQLAPVPFLAVLLTKCLSRLTWRLTGLPPTARLSRVMCW